MAKRRTKGDKSREPSIEKSTDTESDSGGDSEPSPDLPPDLFAETLRTALTDPADEGPWERIEDLATSDPARTQLLELYRSHLAGDPAAPVRELLARRAVRFAADCFGENTAPVTDLLRQVIAALPSADWAFQHLVVALTMSERWPELLEAHDVRLAATKDPVRRKELLEEAAQIAKDFLGDQGRAIGYLEQLFRLKPSDVQVASSLERLLERQERWEDLVQLWRRRAETLSGAQARDLQRRVAVALYEKLQRPEAALEQVRLLLPDEGEETPLLSLLERVLSDGAAPGASRLAALSLLRQRHEGGGKRERVPELLQIAIRFSEGEELRSLRRECGERLFVLGDADGAIDQYVALACLLPEDREVEDRLRQLAETAGDLGRLARGLAAAASACGAADRRIELLTRAALVHDRQLGNRAEAAALFEEAIAHPAVGAELRLSTLRRLEELYAELGDDGKRLHTLERLAAVEPKRGEQRLVWARVAELAAKLGEVDRALAAWEARLASDPADLEALGAEARLLESAGRWPELIAALRRRVTTAPSPHQIRADLVRIATVAKERLADPAAATEAWGEITARFGEDAESVSALADLYSAQERFAELADLLSRSALVDRQRHAAMLCRLGDLQRERLDAKKEALDWYGRALQVEPEQTGARAGLQALLGDPSLAAAAAEALAAAAERTDSWELLLELLPHRLAGASEAPRRVRLLQEAAVRAETRAADQKRAFEWVAQALPQTGADLLLKRELLRLAEATGAWERAARALGEAIEAGEGPPALLAELAEERGQLLEQRLNDLEGARASHARGLAWSPQRLELRLGLVRTAARLGRWAEAASTVVDATVAPAVREGTLLPLLESIALETDSVAAAAAALGQATDLASELPATIRRDLYERVARLHLDRGPDLAAAAVALGRAQALDPEHLPLLSLRAELQRRSPDRQLWETLWALAGRDPGNLDHLRDAAELALGTLKDASLAENALGRLWIESVRLMRLPAPALGQHPAAEAAAYALERLVELHAGSRVAERVRRACELLLEGARLSFAADRRQAWLTRAAELSENPLQDRPAAIGAWRLLYEQSPSGSPEQDRAREALARLYEEEQRHGEAGALRVAELALTTRTDRRLALRLEITRLAALAERKAGQAEVLRANLAEQPGHPDSVCRLSEVLGQTGRSGELADILEEQAQILETRAEPGPPAELWAQAARLAERALRDPARAVNAWERVTKLQPTAEALDALGALKSGTGDFIAAAAWLDRRLNMTEGAARAEVTARLARAYLAAGQRHRAIASLERTLTELPRAEELRTLLAELYRGAQAHEQLARVLADSCDHVDDQSLMVSRAREAAELYAQLGLLARAVPVLEKAVRLLPADESLRSALADGLQQCGRHQEARALLLQLIEEAGWRRSRKKAVLHERLARVARQAGDLPFALEHLEQAASMEVANAEVLVQLAEVAQATGEVERAERAYRALLVLKRKEGGSAGGPAATEVLLRLHDLASKRGHAEQAAELLDSALEAAIGDAGEAERLQRALLDRGAHAALTRLFDKRRQHSAGSPAEADVYGEMAESLRRQGRLEEAFEAQVLAIQAAPERSPLHEAAARLARDQDRVSVLVERLVALAGKRRRKPDAEVAGGLLLTAAQLSENDLGDIDRALELYRRAEETGSRSLELSSALGQIAVKRGDVAECTRIAGLLRQRAGEAATPELAADALYRVAAIELPRVETREAGIASLGKALEKSHQIDRAMALVTAAALPQAELVKILPLYERVARASGDDKMLFDYLDRRAEAPSVMLSEVREAVDLALALGRSERVEALLLRMAEVAGAQADGKTEVAWALLELVQRRKATGDLEGAAQHLDRAAEVLEPERVLALARELGERAARAGNLRLGTQLLERLRTRNPGDESLWRPLLAHYIQMADPEGVERVVGETLPLLVESAKRNELRVTRARFLLDRDERDAAAAEALRDVLLEDPRHGEALPLLAAYYERIGSETDLIELLEQCFEQRAEAGDKEGAIEAALRLGRVLERTASDRAAALYERALQVEPGQRDLLRRLLALTPAEEITAAKATLLEGLLAEDAALEAAGLARSLAEVWNRLGDAAAVRRVLERGCALVPTDDVLAGQLERWYRDHECWAPLAELLAAEAVRQPDNAEAAAIFCEAASLRASRLADAAGALDLLREARARVPEDTDVLALLARALVETGDAAVALAEVQAALDGASAGRKLPLLLLQAELHNRRPDRRSAVAALQEAYTLSPGEAFNPLTDVLVAWRQEAAGAGDVEGLQDATLILADTLRRRGALAEARQFVYELLAAGNADARAIRMAGELAAEAGDLEGALAGAIRLLPLVEGDEQIAAAERVAELAERVGRPAEAIGPFETALAANPGEARLVGRLAQLYEAAGDTRKLAMLLFDQAQRSSEEEQRYRYLTRAGALMAQAGDGSVALMALNEAHAMRPNDPETMLLLSDVYTQAGDWRAAANLLQPLIAAHKGKASSALSALYVRLARIAARVGDSKAELAALSRALDADKKNGAVATELADRAEALGDFDLATKALRLITVHQAAGSLSIAVAFLRQARIAHRRGELDRAVLFARRAVQEAAQDDPVAAESQEFLRSVGAG